MREPDEFSLHSNIIIEWGLTKNTFNITCGIDSIHRFEDRFYSIVGCWIIPCPLNNHLDCKSRGIFDKLLDKSFVFCTPLNMECGVSPLAI